MKYFILAFVFLIDLTVKAETPLIIFSEPVEGFERDLSKLSEEGFAKQWSSIIRRVNLLKYIANENSPFSHSVADAALIYSPKNFHFPNRDFRSFLEFRNQEPQFARFFYSAVFEQALVLDFLMTKKYDDTSLKARHQLVWSFLQNNAKDYSLSDVFKILSELSIHGEKQPMIIFKHSEGPSAGGFYLRVEDSRTTIEIQEFANKLLLKWKDASQKVETVLATKEDEFQVKVYKAQNRLNGRVEDYTNACLSSF